MIITMNIGLATPQAIKKPRPVQDSDFHDDGAPKPEKVELGRLLFFDKILSGNENISCATCHHPLTGTADGLPLSVGEGAKGLGITRDLGSGADAVHERVPRNAPQVFNLGAKHFTVMFHDGRVSVNPAGTNGFDSPTSQLPMGLDNALAAQAMFPVTSATEMAGQLGENAQANAAASDALGGQGGVWDIIALKLQAIPEYVTLFQAAFPDINTASDITYVHAANAIAAFEAVKWRFTDSPFDRYLNNDHHAISKAAKNGLTLFYGSAGCASCHSGAFQTDLGFHSIAMPQIGPGKGQNLPGYTDGRDDLGREAVSLSAEDRFRFRTPSLRNVALSAPYGHSGAYETLEGVVRHHLDPVGSLMNYDQSQVRMPSRPDLDSLDFVVMNDPNRVAAIASSNQLAPQSLTDEQVHNILEFLHSLTDTAALDMRSDVPMKVPSGLPIFD